MHTQSKRQRPQIGRIMQRIWIVPKQSYLISIETTKKQYPLRTLLLTVDSLNPILCDFLRILWVYPLPPICVTSGEISQQGFLSQPMTASCPSQKAAVSLTCLILIEPSRRNMVSHPESIGSGSKPFPCIVYFILNDTYLLLYPTYRRY